MILRHIVEISEAGATLKHILNNRLNLSSSLQSRLRAENKITVNGQPGRRIDRVNAGDIVCADIDFDERSETIEPQEGPIDVLFEDDCLTAVDKPAGTVVHPTSYHQTGTLANFLSWHAAERGESFVIRPVTRLDRDTSGVVIFAKNQYVQTSLIAQMKSGAFEKRYIGLVHGEWDRPCGTIDQPIARKPGSIMERHVHSDGAPSVTHYTALASTGGTTLTGFKLETGRTHQIRVHCQAAGHPLAGDTMYGVGPDDLLGRQALHCLSNVFVHPVSGLRISLLAPLPVDIADLLARLGYNLKASDI